MVRVRADGGVAVSCISCSRLSSASAPDHVNLELPPSMRSFAQLESAVHFPRVCASYVITWVASSGLTCKMRCGHCGLDGVWDKAWYRSRRLINLRSVFLFVFFLFVLVSFFCLFILGLPFVIYLSLSVCPSLCLHLSLSVVVFLSLTM